MNWTRSIRQLHRWTCIAFTLGVVANIVVQIAKVKADWINLVAGVPLLLLLLTGLWLFAVPYVARARTGSRG